jgi:folate-dependent phosphoribosylglycinamide formyltransferase PurN
MSNDRIVLLTYEGEFGRIAANSLDRRFDDLAVIVEAPASRLAMAKRRLRRLGLAHVLGQILFSIFQRFQLAMARRRVAEIAAAFGLEARWPTGRKMIRMSSINSPECVAELRSLAPRAILVVGTRLISRDVLTSIGVPFINYHSGITPKYRGVHGGYWAQARGDTENFGVTVHLIDEGIDTGGVIYQAKVQPGPNDNFSTYPYLQIAAALPLLELAARDAIAETLTTRAVDLPSCLWSHPTFWNYLTVGFRRGIW